MTWLPGLVSAALFRPLQQGLDHRALLTNVRARDNGI